MLRIVLTGPESSGKTTLALELAAHYGVPWVPEYARSFLKKQGPGYKDSDLEIMARGQIYLERRISVGNLPLLFCDTDLLTYKIWGNYKYGRIDTWILDYLKQHPPSHYFLCGNNIPWKEDPLRENPNDRDELYQIYLLEIQHSKIPFTEISGDLSARLQQTRTLINSWLK